MAETILLKGGVLLIHNHEDKVEVIKADLLIQASRIAAIADTISPEPGTRVIDCTHKIIAPGFVDTHHHLWQTQLKGRHANDTLLNYMAKGNLQASNFTAMDAFWGQLGGCLEALNAGTTTVVDHAHINVSKDHSEMAVTATVSSGIRAIFCYCPHMKVESWSPLEVNFDVLGGHVMTTLRKLAQNAPFGNGRVQLGFAFDLWSMPRETITSLFAEVKSLGVRLITSHYTQMRKPKVESFTHKAKTCGVLDSSLLWSHANSATADLQLIADSGATISSTASTELQMGHGIPLAYEERMQTMRRKIGVGIDCHASSESSIPAELRLGLQAVRAIRNQEFAAKALLPPDLKPTVEEAFNLGTIYGARAAGMDQDIGSVQVGKKADLLIFDAQSPTMICGAQYDPVATIILHSNPSDIECVIVDGTIRKEQRKLLPSDIGELAVSIIGKASVTWEEIVDALLQSREQIQEKTTRINYDKVEQFLRLKFDV